MSELIRFDPVGTIEGFEESEYGKYVFADDAISQLAALREELAKLRDQHAEQSCVFCNNSGELLTEVKSLRQRLADAERRNEMLTDLLRRTQSDGALTYEENLKLESDIDAALNPKPEAASHDE